MARIIAKWRAETFFAANVVLFTILRLIFLAAFRTHPIARTDLWYALWLGLKFDARLAAIVTLPLLFGRAGMVISAIGEALVLVVYAADFACYAYIGQRINAGVLEFLRNPLISAHMAWESYHVVWLALAIVAFIAGVVCILRGSSSPLLVRHLPRRHPRRPRRGVLRDVAVAAISRLFRTSLVILSREDGEGS